MSARPTTDDYSRGRACASKVLVAEDHEDTRVLLRTLLERRGIAVVEAGDGVAAVSLAESERPDLILMDGGLPLLDGLAATRRLRGLASLSGVPIVFLSGHAAPHDPRAARAAGCDEYVVKPFEWARLEGVLNRLLPACCGGAPGGPQGLTGGGLADDDFRLRRVGTDGSDGDGS
ncbi:MAG TPA: response regulator [Pyrinomonadaceae bacterium]|jgi:CheY-like chemotaxis protein